MQQNPEYKQIVALLQHGQQLSAFNPVYSYITKAYAAQRLHALYKKTQQQELMQQLQQLIGELETAKKQNPQLTNKEENKKSYTEFVYKFFYDADTRERDGEVSQELLQMFGAVQKAFEVLQYFEPLTQDQTEKQKYAKFKMVEQHKKIKDPSLIKPKAKDPLEDELEQIANNQISQQQNQIAKSTAPEPMKPQPQQPSSFQQPQPQQQVKRPEPQIPVQQNEFRPPQQQNEYHPPQQQTQPQNIQQAVNPVVNIPNQQSKPTAKLSPMEQATMRNEIKKILQSSISELDFKKYQTAKDQLNKSLGMLQQLLDSQ